MTEGVSTEELEQAIFELDEWYRSDEGLLRAETARAIPHIIRAAREALANRKASAWQRADAPDLYDALLKARNKLHKCIVFSGSAEEHADATCAEFDAVLAKARGEPSP